MARRRSPSPSDPSSILVTRPSLPPLREYERLLRTIWSSRVLTNNGPLVRRLEHELSRYLPARNVAAVANGTLALQLALRAVRGKKRIVLTTPFTFAATTTSLLWEGFTPRFADIDPETFNLDPDSVAERMDDRVGGILSVHVFGNPEGAGEIAEFAQTHGCWMVFDAAHCFGTRTSGKRLFDLGDVSTLSFHATKSFHTFEGGAVVAHAAEIARRIERLRSFGMEESDEISAPGINAKMNEAQAAMGLVNLEHIDRWILARRRRYDLYKETLGSLDEVSFQRVGAARYNYTYMPILLSSRRMRDRVQAGLERSGIFPRRYFFPLTSHFAFLRNAAHEQCPVAEEVAGRVLTLPLYPDLGIPDIRRVVRVLKEGIKSVGR